MKRARLHLDCPPRRCSYAITIRRADRQDTVVQMRMKVCCVCFRRESELATERTRSLAQEVVAARVARRTSAADGERVVTNVDLDR